MAGAAQKDEEEPDDVEGDEDVIHMGDDDEESDGVEDEEWEEADGVSLGMGLDGMDQDPVGFSSSAMAGLAQKIPLPVVALGGVGVGVFVLLKLKRLFGGGDFADSQARPAVQPLREKGGEGSLHAMQARVLLLARVLEGGVETRDLRVLLK